MTSPESIIALADRLADAASSLRAAADFATAALIGAGRSGAGVDLDAGQRAARLTRVRDAAGKLLAEVEGLRRAVAGDVAEALRAG